MTSNPKRVQLSRLKGWRKPQNTVVVSRPGKWGNPYNWKECPADVGPAEWAKAAAVDAFREQLLTGFGSHPLPITCDDVRRELRGKNLACWCRPDQPCHADVLLEIANG